MHFQTKPAYIQILRNLNKKLPPKGGTDTKFNMSRIVPKIKTTLYTCIPNFILNMICLSFCVIIISTGWYGKTHHKLKSEQQKLKTIKYSKKNCNCIS